MVKVVAVLPKHLGELPSLSVTLQSHSEMPPSRKTLVLQPITSLTMRVIEPIAAGMTESSGDRVSAHLVSPVYHYFQSSMDNVDWCHRRPKWSLK